MGRVIDINSHLNVVEDEFNMGGLSTGLYGEYANDVAISFSYDLLIKLKSEGKLNMTELEIHNLLHDKEQVLYVDS